MTMNELAKQLGMGGTDINAIRQAVVSQEFMINKEKRALILISAYPFLIIGRIDAVISDYLVIEAEVTNVSELDGETFRVHIDDIEVFYIETKERPIPDIRNEKHD